MEGDEAGSGWLVEATEVGDGESRQRQGSACARGEESGGEAGGQDPDGGVDANHATGRAVGARAVGVWKFRKVLSGPYRV